MTAEHASADSDDVQRIKNEIDDDLLDAAADADIDVNAIVADNLERRSGEYQDHIIAKFAKNAVEAEVEAEKAETLKGIAVGSRDRYGSNSPVRHSLVRSSGEHVEISTWGTKVPGPDGTEVQMPSSAIIEIDAEYNQEYEDYNAVKLRSAKPLDSPELVESLSKVAVDPSAIGPEDEYSLRVVTGEIRWFSPQTVFEGDDQDDWYDGDVMMADSHGNELPHFEVGISAEDSSTRFRAHAQRMSNARPLFDIPDLERLCADAAEEFQDPESQAGVLQDIYQGEEVILVGVVTGYDTDRDDDGNPVEYVDFGISAIVSANQVDLDAFSGDEAGSADGDDEVDVASAIEDYERVTGEDIETVADARENIAQIDDSVDDVEIRAALGDVDAEGESDDDPFEPLLEGGTYTCPGEDCLASAGSIEELAGHVTSEHDVDGYDDPTGWLKEAM